MLTDWMNEECLEHARTSPVRERDTKFVAQVKMLNFKFDELDVAKGQFVKLFLCLFVIKLSDFTN
jgi:hypothetical protein